MAKKKTRGKSLEQIKQAIWDIILNNVENDTPIGAYDNEAQTLLKQLRTKVAREPAEFEGFKTNTLDRAKILREVEDSCLTEATKKAIRKAAGL